jgi:hypothetical protein
MLCFLLWLSDRIDMVRNISVFFPFTNLYCVYLEKNAIFCSNQSPRTCVLMNPCYRISVFFPITYRSPTFIIWIYVYCLTKRAQYFVYLLISICFHNVIWTYLRLAWIMVLHFQELLANANASRLRSYMWPFLSSPDVRPSQLVLCAGRKNPLFYIATTCC